MTEPPFYAWQRLTLAGEFILQKQTIFVNQKKKGKRDGLWTFRVKSLIDSTVFGEFKRAAEGVSPYTG